jgi:hypothetical protein
MDRLSERLGSSRVLPSIEMPAEVFDIVEKRKQGMHQIHN